MTPGRLSPRSEFNMVPSHGSIFVYMILPQNVIPVRVTPAWVHPGSCTGARISLRYEISQRYHVNAKRPPVSVWNRSAGRLERVAHAWCLRFWITRVFYYHVYLQMTRYEMTQSSCKRVASPADILRRTPKNVCGGGYAFTWWLGHFIPRHLKVHMIIKYTCDSKSQTSRMRYPFQSTGRPISHRNGWSFRVYMIPLRDFIPEWNSRPGTRTGVNSRRGDSHRYDILR